MLYLFFDLNCAPAVCVLERVFVVCESQHYLISGGRRRRSPPGHSLQLLLQLCYFVLLPCDFIFQQYCRVVTCFKVLVQRLGLDSQLRILLRQRLQLLVSHSSRLQLVH